MTGTFAPSRRFSANAIKLGCFVLLSNTRINGQLSLHTSYLGGVASPLDLSLTVPKERQHDCDN